MARRKKSDTVKVNFKDVESRRTPPEGDYVVSVLEANAGKSSANNDQIEFVCEIAEGEYKGVKLWLYCPLQDNSLWKLHAFLTALGEEVPDEEMDIDLPELVGKRCVGVVTHETYNGRKRAKMTDFDSLDNYEGDAEGAGKKSKKDKKGKKDKDADAKGGKGKKSKSDDADAGKKGKKGKKPKKLDQSDVEDMDEDELEKLVDEHDLDVDLDDFPKLPKKVKAVVKALKAADLLA